MSKTRQLAAIMFTDIQGYTALMQQDEKRAIEIRERHREIFNNTTEKFNGKILQYYGDGTLSIFNSAIDAVNCAIEMQLAFQLEPVIPVRIGIHLGDIIYSDEEIIGDGVNVASRIESLAVPGSIFISDKVYDEIKNQPKIQTQSLKTFELKNVERPVEVFAISNKGLVIPKAHEIEGKTNILSTPQPTNKLTQFWQELKRRKVFRVLAMYATTAFVLLELVDIITPALYLPSWIPTLIIVLLVIGFPFAVIFSWIFDITPEGVKKTESIEVAKEQEPPSVPVKRRLKVSDVVIAVLIVVVGILVYPKIFKKDKFEGIRNPDGKISIAVMPFDNLSGDTVYNVWQGGFQNLLITTLSNSKELSVRQYQAMYDILESKRNLTHASITPSVASELALKLETRIFILGNILKAGNKIRVNAQLVNAETEEIYKTYQVDGNTEDDIFAMADSLSGLIKNYLEIRKFVEQHDSPVYHESFYTNSSEAFQYYIHGHNAFMDLDFQAATKWLSKAIETDSGFITAYGMLSFTYQSMGYDKLARNWCNMAYKKRHEMPLKGELMLEFLNAYYYETPNEEIKYLKQILEIDELNSDYWYLLGNAYYEKHQYRDAVISYKKALEIHKNWGTDYHNPFIYSLLGGSYHKVNEHKREKEVYEIGLSIFPDLAGIIQRQAICALSQGKTDEADNFIAKYKSIRKNKHRWSESRILSGLGDIYLVADLFDEAEINFRQAHKLDSGNPAIMYPLALFLINNDINVNEGIDLIQKALELKPDNWYYLDTKGWGLYKQGRYEEALKVFKDSWDLRPAYDYEGFLHIQEVEQALANQNK